MKKKQVKDIRVAIKYDGDIVVDEYNYFSLYILYKYYLRFKDIRLTYKDIDLYEYAKSHKYGKGNPDVKENWETLVDKQNAKFSKLNVIINCGNSLILFLLYASTTNFIHHENINIENSKYILENYMKDIDNDGIKDLLIDEIGNGDYMYPSEDIFYNVTNPFYHLSDYNKIASYSSISRAASELNVYKFEIDNEIYTCSGKLSYATYDLNGDTYMINLPFGFDSKEHGEEMICYFLDKSDIKDYSNVDYIGTIDVNDFSEFPRIYKSKKDDSIKIKEPNKALNRIIKSIH